MTHEQQSSCMCGGTLINTVVEDIWRVRHDGATHNVHVSVPALECKACHERQFSADADDLIRRQLRIDLNLLMPETIKQLRTRYALTQEQLGEATGIAAESISRWENDRVIQSISHDKHLRLYFEKLQSLHDRCAGWRSSIFDGDMPSAHLTFSSSIIIQPPDISDSSTTSASTEALPGQLLLAA